MRSYFGNSLILLGPLHLHRNGKLDNYIAASVLDGAQSREPGKSSERQIDKGRKGRQIGWRSRMPETCGRKGGRAAGARAWRRCNVGLDDGLRP